MNNSAVPQYEMPGCNYSKWEKFSKVIYKAKSACEASGIVVKYHFPDVGKMVDIGNGTQRPVEDLALTRYACYLVAQNGDPPKSEIAFAQTFFLTPGIQKYCGMPGIRQRVSDKNFV